MTPKQFALMARGFTAKDPRKATATELATEWKASVQAHAAADTAVVQATAHRMRTEKALTAVWERCQQFINDLEAAEDE